MYRRVSTQPPTLSSLLSISLTQMTAAHDIQEDIEYVFQCTNYGILTTLTPVSNLNPWHTQRGLRFTATTTAIPKSSSSNLHATRMGTRGGCGPPECHVKLEHQRRPNTTPLRHEHDRNRTGSGLARAVVSNRRHVFSHRVVSRRVVLGPQPRYGIEPQEALLVESRPCSWQPCMSILLT